MKFIEDIRSVFERDPSARNSFLPRSQASAWKQELGNEVERLKEIENSFVSRSQAPAWECI
jgi:hypothetical protein